jgi:hypothetical protein
LGYGPEGLRAARHASRQDNLLGAVPHGWPRRPDEAAIARPAGIAPWTGEQARDAKRFTVAELADRYLEPHVDMKNKASTAKEFRRLVEKVIKPRLAASFVCGGGRVGQTVVKRR